MLDLVLKTKIPIIGVHTDDTMNAVACLQLIAGSGRTVGVIPGMKTAPLNPQVLYYTFQDEDVTADLYKKANNAGAQIVVINPSKSELIFDGGTLPTPSPLVKKYLEGYVAEDHLKSTLAALEGLSLRRIGEVVQLTMARTGGLLPTEIRATRLILDGDTLGLQPITPHYAFYEAPVELQGWLNLNTPYFPNPLADSRLVPRGVLLTGPTGTGKTLAAQVIAFTFNVPLYRVDIASILNKYIGTSETRMATLLAQLDKAAPCVALFDEMEKLFGGDGDEGTPNRLLAQLLWWLQEHQSKVITIMTTNNFQALPEELYRPQRVDKVLHFDGLTRLEAHHFATAVYETSFQSPSHVSKLILQKLWKAVDELYIGKHILSQAVITGAVYGLAKALGWGLKNNS